MALLDVERSRYTALHRTASQELNTPHSSPMPLLSARLKASLDTARGTAALYVVLHHLANARGWSNGIGMVFRFGQEAVLIFFLLSGFVIFANERSRAKNPRGYYLRRIRRIYPTLLAAIAFSTLVYLDNRTFFASFHWEELLGTVLGVQDISSLKPGVVVGPYLNNEPLWSLSYELAFYVVFPLVLRLWLRDPLLTNHAIGFVCCAAYAIYMVVPNHWCLVAAYYLIWWCGAMAANGYLRGCRNICSMMVSLCWLLALTLIAAAGVYVQVYRGLGFTHFSC